MSDTGIYNAIPEAEPLPTELALFEPIQATMAEYKAENEKLVFDYRDAQGNKDARSHVYKLRGVKTKITSAHKDAKAGALAVCRQIDGMKNKLMTEVEEMIKVHNEPLLLIEKEKAEAEAERLRKLKEAEEEAARKREEELAAREAAVKEKEEKAAAEERAKRAEEERIKAEAEQAERDKKIAEEAKAKAEADAKAALEAAEKKRLADVAAAEQRAADEARRVEQAERRKREQEQAEKERQEAEEKRRQENTRHRNNVHKDILARLEELVLEGNQAQHVLQALQEGTIPHVKIEY
jgi:hypothetical protein